MYGLLMVNYQEFQKTPYISCVLKHSSLKNPPLATSCRGASSCNLACLFSHVCSVHLKRFKVSLLLAMLRRHHHYVLSISCSVNKLYSTHPRSPQDSLHTRVNLFSTIVKSMVSVFTCFHLFFLMCKSLGHVPAGLVSGSQLPNSSIKAILAPCPQPCQRRRELSLTAAKLSTAVNSSGGSYVGIFET